MNIKLKILQLIKAFSLAEKTDEFIYFRWNNNPYLNSPNKKSYYAKLYKKVIKKKYPFIDKIEKELGFRINKKWLNELAFHTQVVKKQSEINYQHGRVLYSLLRAHIKKNKLLYVNIFETGTARGFSSLCMAKALNDHHTFGKILTLDILPHNRPIYWNIIDDSQGKKTRKELLAKYSKLLNNYIIFFQNYSEIGIKHIDMGRIHFAFLDGNHTADTLCKEIEYVVSRQKKGDMIVFDDYDEKQFPEVVSAVDEFLKTNNYEARKYRADKSLTRFYVCATKK